MDKAHLLTMPLWQMTGADLLELTRQSGIQEAVQQTANTADVKNYVYGIAGIAKLFNCSESTANRIKASGKIDRAIKQVGRKIIVDAQLALELAGQKIGGRRKV